jgi:hypothetical protein
MAAAAAIKEGFVVASVGLNWMMELISPVSETTVVILRSCSRRFGIERSFVHLSFYQRSEMRA